MPAHSSSPQSSLAHLGDPDWAIIDCRFDLARPALGRAAPARAGHIPHALYAHLDARSVRAAHRAQRPPSAAGRRPRSPPPSAGSASMRAVQVDRLRPGPGRVRGAAVVAAALARAPPGRGAQRRLRGLGACRAAGEHAQTRRAPARHFSARAAAAHAGEHARQVAAASRRGAQRGEMLLVDARSADRFAGENETLDPVAGHIPGARNHPFAAQPRRATDAFSPPRELRQRWEQHAARPAGGARLIAMCGSGVTACHNLLALEVAGLPRRAAVRGLLERVDPRPGARGGARTRDELRDACTLTCTRNFDITRPVAADPKSAVNGASQVQSRAALAHRGLPRPLQRARLGQGLLRRQRRRATWWCGPTPPRATRSTCTRWSRASRRAT